MVRTSVLIALMGLAVAGAARAEDAGPPMSRIVWTPKPALDIADPRLSPGAAYAPRVRAPDPTGIRRTAVDRSFDSATTGALGYLCGLEPAPNEASGGVASSREAAGTFLGGQLKMAFGR